MFNGEKSTISMVKICQNTQPLRPHLLPAEALEVLEAQTTAGPAGKDVNGDVNDFCWILWGFCGD